MTVTSAGTLTAAPAPAPCCPKCGFGLALPPLDETQAALVNAQRAISDLEAQVRLLNQKASAAVDRWADYEDEITKLRAELNSRPQTPTPQQPLATTKQTSLPTPPSSAAGAPPTPSPSRASFLTTGAAARISALLSSRKSPPTTTAAPALSPIPSLPSTASLPPQSYAPLSPPPHSGPTNPTTVSGTDTDANLTTSDLLSALSREQALRQAAEGKLDATSREVEELSASLFEQANEMVASERRARARLEERVGVLERREVEGRRRLEGLERAVGRIERVRGVLSGL